MNGCTGDTRLGTICDSRIRMIKLFLTRTELVRKQLRLENIFELGTDGVDN